ncbi:MAG: hypothetical protein ACOX45_05980 [Acutalibacteraceae bacterium]
MLIEELNRIKEQRGLISIYTDTNNTCKFTVGYVAGVSEQHFILALVTPTGEYDGFLLKELDSIYKITTDELYLNKLLKLINMKQTEFNMLFESNDLIEELLIFAQKRHKILSIELMNSGYDDCIGFIELINESMCKTQEINEFGKYDGISIVNLSDITQISCDDTDNRTRMTLYELR